MVVLPLPSKLYLTNNFGIRLTILLHLIHSLFAIISSFSLCHSFSQHRFPLLPSSFNILALPFTFLPRQLLHTLHTGPFNCSHLIHHRLNALSRIHTSCRGVDSELPDQEMLLDLPVVRVPSILLRLQSIMSKVLIAVPCVSGMTRLIPSRHPLRSEIRSNLQRSSKLHLPLNERRIQCSQTSHKNVSDLAC